MECRNHPSVSAEDRCCACAEPFCNDCLLTIHGERYCASCKMMTVKGPPAPPDGTTPCEAANKALLYAIIGIFCLGFVFGPMAVAQGIEARKAINADPDLCGLAKANIGLVLGATVFVFWLVGLISRVTSS